MRRVSPLLVVTLVAAAVTGSGLTAAVLTLGTASAFARIYLDALAAGDVRGALAMPGMRVSAADASRLERIGPAELRVDRIDELVVDDVHHLTVTWSGGGATSQTELLVRGDGLGWRFQATPLVSATVHAAPARVVRLGAASVPTAADGSVESVLLAPGAYAVRASDAADTSAPAQLVTAAVGTTAEATVTVSASQSLTEAAGRALDRVLAACAESQVLQPAGCPFGYQLTDRLVGVPKWSILGRPRSELVPGSFAGQWQLRVGNGSASIALQAQRLADGRIQAVSDTVEIAGSWPLEVSATGVVTLGALSQ